MALFDVNHDKFIDSLFALPKEKDLREGVFSLTVKEDDRPGATITLAIQPGAGSLLHVPEREAPQAVPSIRTVTTTSHFLSECHRKLFAGNPDYERQLIISGPSLGDNSSMLDILIEPKLANVSAAGVEADLSDLFSHLAELDDRFGLLLLGIFHSHLWKGRSAVTPSATDRALQENLEKSGYQTVQAIFSADGLINVFTNTIPFALNVIGTGVEEVETHEHQTVVRLLPVASPAGRQGTQSPHLSHQTLHTAQQARGQRLSSPNADPRV
jgi:hypothetical protein